MFFNHFSFLQVIHCHYQSQARSMPSKEDWFTYDTTVFLHLSNQSYQRKEMHKEKQRNDGHLQHIMASLVIIYNLCSDFLFLFWYCTDLSSERTTDDTRKHQWLSVLNNWTLTGSNRVVHTPDCSKKRSCRSWFLHPVFTAPQQEQPLYNAVQSGA